MIKLKSILLENKKQTLNEGEFITSVWMLAVGLLVFGGTLKYVITRLLFKNIFTKTWQWLRPGALKKSLQNPDVLKKAGISEDVAEKAVRELERNPSLISKLQAEVQKKLLKNVKSGKITVDQAYNELQGFYTTAAEKQQLRKNLEQIYPQKSGYGKLGKQYLNPKYVRSFKLQDTQFTQDDFDRFIYKHTDRGSHLGNMYGQPRFHRSILYQLRKKIDAGKVDASDIIYGNKRYVFGVGRIPDSVVNQIADYETLRGWLKSGLNLKDTTLAYKGWYDAGWKKDIAEQLRDNGIRWSNLSSAKQNRLSQLMWYLIKNKPIQGGQTVTWG